MPPLPPAITPERWIVQLFSARAVAEGGVVRRRIRDVDRLIGQERFLTEVRRRGFRVVRNADQYVIFCNREPVELLE
ncbi:MAG: N-(5'-phosphoribosyl)anthranilate isomerase [Pararhodobacter sp.]|nr:N-(5'-phosphoribosyl)anthranilate isomerase [Pararhodobacter sp.]